MTEDRRKQWMLVFEWFQRQESTPGLDSLWSRLNEMFQQERTGPNDIEDDPELQEFMQALDRAFSNKPKPPLEK